MFATSSNGSSRRLVRLVLAGAVAALAALVAFDQPVRGASATVVISEFRVRGPNGGSDEFVELYNASASPVAIGGWKINASNNAGTTGTRATIPSGVTLLPGCHYLLTNSSSSGGPYSGAVAGDQTYATGITDDGGIALLDAGSAIVDQVGMSAGSAYKEGTFLTPLGSSNLNRGYERKPGGVLGSGTDTDSNAADFQLISPSDPQNASSPCTSTAEALTAIGLATPSQAGAGETVVLTVELRVGSEPAPAGGAVLGDLTAIGGSNEQPFRDDGQMGDTAAGDSLFTFVAEIGAAALPGSKTLPVVATDGGGRGAAGAITLTVSQPPLAIHDIQGPGAASPFEGQTVTTSGVVTARRSNGFYLQSPDAGADADPRTSEGLFAYTGSSPAMVSLGDVVQVTGSVTEYAPGGPGTPTITELTNAQVTVLAPGSDFPAPVTLTAADLPATGTVGQLEYLESMRVFVPSLLVVAPTDGTPNEAAGTVSSNGVFYGVVGATARPFREEGIPADAALPPGAPATVPRFDNNPERLRIDSDGQLGAARVEVRAGTTLTSVLGVLDFGYNTWTVLPDPGALPAPDLPAASPVEPAGAHEFGVASFNLERLFDTVNDPGVSDAVLQPATFEKRLAKASRAVLEILHAPEVLGVQEVENLATLQALAARINAEGSLPAPGYVAYLEEGNDVGGIDVGFLVRADRVEVLSVAQEGKDEPFVEPGGDTSLLNDRPPLLMRARVHGPTGDLPLTVIVNHLRSMSGIDDPSTGDRVRAKRRAQAEYLARLIQQRQAADPSERIVSVGDYNAFEVNDGYVDVIGTVRGAPAPPEAVTLASPDLVTPDLVDLVETLPAGERYSYVFDGTAQALDHILVNGAARPRVTRFQYARSNADYPESLRYDDTRPERVSDHDVPLAYFAFPNAPVLVLNGTSPMTVECCGTFTDPGATATDDDFGDISSWIVTAGSVDASRVGTYSLTYSVSNGYAVAEAVRTVHVADTIPPVLLLHGPATMSVELGSTFEDPGLSAWDTCAGDLANWVAIAGAVDTSRLGSYTLTYTVSDGFNTTAATRTVHVVDTTPPTISALTVTPSVIWPANHQWVTAALGYTVEDNSGAATCSAAVSSNEPVNGTGDGDTSPDWLVDGAASVRLRAERAGTGTGREYTIEVTCRDASGNAASAAGRAWVPKSAAAPKGAKG